jgi:drug/metabolite transporter (DMT)-like permease
MSMLNNSCPGCGYRFKKSRIFPCHGLVRKIVKCSNCGEDLIWSRRAWQMVVGGMLLAVALTLLDGIFDRDDSLTPEAVFCIALATIGLCVSAVGFFTLHFVKLEQRTSTSC